jgi:dephospho-CoA kinase
MLRVGLTGGLASGKSTVAGFFRELGAFHVDADRIAHELLAPGGRAEAEVVARFGRGIVGAGGAIDRKALAAIVFADPHALADLNALVHPKVREEIDRRIATQASAAAGAAVALVDAALLVETGMDRDLDALVVVSCRPATQVARAVARGGLTEDEAQRRVAAQAPLAEKLAAADFVIDNGGSADETRRQVRAVWDDLLRRGRLRG